MELPIQVDSEKIAGFCKKHHIIKLTFYGSVLTERFQEDSDVDVLVDFDSEHIPTLLDMVGMEDELAQLLGRKADLRTPEDLSRFFRDEVVQSAHVQYAA